MKTVLERWQCLKYNVISSKHQNSTTTISKVQIRWEKAHTFFGFAQHLTPGSQLGRIKYLKYKVAVIEKYNSL